MKPNYLIIGVQKSATTSAERYLNQHPDIHCNWGEIHFFDRPENYKKGIKWYEDKLQTNKKFTGEKTPTYIFFKKSVNKIHKFYPNIKLIIFLRDPVFRAYSQYNHMIQESQKGDKKFRMYINPKTTMGDIIKKDLKRKNYEVQRTVIQRGFYLEQIQYLLTKFKRSQIKIIIAEWYKKDPLKWNNEIYKFIGTYPLKQVKPQMQHKREYVIKINEKDKKRLHKIYKKHNERLFKFLGYKIPEWI